MDNEFGISLYNMGIPINMPSLIFMMGFWVASVITTRILYKTSDTFRGMSIRHQRNVVTYILQIVATTISFFVFTIGFPRLITVSSIDKSFDENDTIVASMGIGLVFYLYIFELIYKTELNMAIIIHHLLTITMTALTCFMLWDTLNPAAVYPIILAYHAITEQPIFVALLLYRFGYNAKFWFRFSAVRCVLFNTVICALTFIVLKKCILDVEFTNHRNDFDWKTFMSIVIPVVNVSLFIVQMYSANIYWILGNKPVVKPVEPVEEYQVKVVTMVADSESDIEKGFSANVGGQEFPL